MPPLPGCPSEVPLLPKLQGHFAEFLQHHSLKRLSILYSTTSVGFGYGQYDSAISWKFLTAPSNPIRKEQQLTFVTSVWPRNINLVPIDYDFRPRLRGRLTLRGLPWRRNPWSFGGSVSHTPLRYSCQHSHFRYLHRPLQDSFTGLRNAPLPLIINYQSASSVYGFSPGTFSAQASLTRPVSYYAFFKGWLLLSQPPGCLGLPTSFPT